MENIDFNLKIVDLEESSNVAKNLDAYFENLSILIDDL